MATVEFTLLGPVEAARESNKLALGPPAQRTVLATMLLRLGDVVSPVVIAQGLWGGERVPHTADGLVRTYISRLRRLLGPGVIETVPGGYRIPVGAVGVDLATFVDLVRTARRRRDQADPEGMVAALREALSLWRGPPLGGTTEPFSRLHVARLEERRLDVLESCLMAEVANGRHRDVVDELTSAAAEHPLREGLVRACMMALHECGRTAQAITTFHGTRKLLIRELGIDPSPELQACYADMIRPNPAVAAVESRRDICRDVRPESLQLRGRDAYVRSQLTSDRAVTVIEGMPGVGKTALAIDLSSRLAEEFPHGRLLLDLGGHRGNSSPVTPAEALDSLLRVVGAEPAPPGSGLRQRAAMWQAAATELSLLVILDGATSSAQVRPLLVHGPRSRFLVTSRQSLVLDHASTLVIGPLSLVDGVDMLVDIVGSTRIRAEREAAVALVKACGGLPLAIRIAGVRLRQRPAWTVAHLVSRMADDSRRLTELRMDDQDVAAAFAASYSALEPSARNMLRSLSESPATMSFCAGAAAADAGTDAEQAGVDLERLLDAHLLLQYEPDRYVLHDLVRSYVRFSSLKITDRRLDITASW